MQRVNVKPLSVNEAYKGRRFRTKDHDNYKNTLQILLPKVALPKPPYEVSYKFGLSSRASDADNCCKLFTDALANKYGFNDKLIYRFVLEKVKVDKGKEFIEFEIKHYEPC